MGLGTDYHTLTQTHHSWVWVRNLFTQSKIVNIVIILNIIDTPTTTQDNPYPSLRVWVCMGMGQGRGKNTHGLPMSHTNHSLVRSPFHNISAVTYNNVPALCGSQATWPWLRTLVILDRSFLDIGLRDHGIVHSQFNNICRVTYNNEPVLCGSRAK